MELKKKSEMSRQSNKIMAIYIYQESILWKVRNKIIKYAILRDRNTVHRNEQ